MATSPTPNENADINRSAIDLELSAKDRESTVDYVWTKLNIPAYLDKAHSCKNYKSNRFCSSLDDIASLIHFASPSTTNQMMSPITS
ncbi:hypothetical protein M8J77_000199 [Diaphorina citri]|nr:hypothetical protein M8J77_000199 [Diaphorina citri]